MARGWLRAILCVVLLPVSDVRAGSGNGDAAGNRGASPSSTSSTSSGDSSEVIRPPEASADPAIRQVRALMGLADPSADDWTTEVDADHAKHALAELASALKKNRSVDAEAVAPFFVDGCRLAALRPLASDITTVGAATVRRFAFSGGESPEPDGGGRATLAPHVALRRLIEPHGGASDFRLFPKIVGVVPVDESTYATEALIEISSARPGARIQQTMTWAVMWKTSGDRAHPKISRIRPIRMTEVTAEGASFADRTRSVIRDDDLWNRRLARGYEWWYGRLDTLGGVNFIGSEGLAVGDVNGDGRDDLYVCMGAGMPNLLFVQQEDGTVREVGHEAHVDWLDHSRGALLIDLDNDGDQDLVVAMDSTVGFLENDGGGHFTPRRRYVMPPSNLGPFYSLAAADYDNDGDLDIYACRYLKAGYGVYPPEPYHDANNGPSNHLLRNDGDQGINDATYPAGLGENNARFSVCATWFDYDEDGDSDLYVANDFGRNNLYRNDGGHFKDVAADANVEDQASGMGISWSDFDHDGDFDLLVSNMFSSAGRRITFQPRAMADAPAEDREALQRLTLGNTLMVNGGNGTFSDRSEHAGVHMGRWAWGSMFVDIDNDGYDDIVVPNGFLTNESKDDL